MDNEDDVNIIVGEPGQVTLSGSNGDDKFIEIGDAETIFGSGGIDTVVFEGQTEDFSIDQDGPGDVFFAEKASAHDIKTFDVEFFQFDNETISFLDLFDDFGDTRDTAGFISLNPVSPIITKPIAPLTPAVVAKAPAEEIGVERSVGFGKGNIDATGDIDGFTVQLEEGETYIIDVFSFGSFSGSDNLVLVSGVFDPNDVLIDGSETIGRSATVVAQESGEYFFTVQSPGDSGIGYDIQIDQVRLIGDSGNNNLFGTHEADTLEGGAGDDFINGNGGVDIAVFDGNRDAFTISNDAEPIGPPKLLAPPVQTEKFGARVSVVNQNSFERDDLLNVEILRFDDGDVSVLEFVDDFGDDLATAGKLNLTPFGKKGSELTAKISGRIDVIGDVDAFAVTLEAGETFSLDVEESLFIGLFNGPTDASDAATSETSVIIESVLGPDGNPVELRRDSRFEPNPDEGGFGSSFRSFQSSVAGTYLISVGAVEERIPGYSLKLSQNARIGDDVENSFVGSPFNDTIDAGAGNDFILFSAGIDSIDGGEGLQDSFLAVAKAEDFDFSVSKDGVITLKGPDDAVSTISNVEIFEFFDVETISTTKVLASDLLAFAEQVEEDEVFTVNTAQDGGDELSGGLGSDGYFGGHGDDIITDPGGNSRVNAAEGADRIGLVSGNNVVDGGSESDLIIGGIGSDDLSGGTGDDVIIGDVSTNLFGSDRINGGADNDLLEGRGGQDTFVFATGDGEDTIGALAVDFDDLSNTSVTGADFVSGLDLIELDGFGYADQDAAFANVTDVAGVATFSDQGTTITFSGLTASDLSSDDFILV